MKKFNILLLLCTILLSACDSKSVLIRGEILELDGPVKLFAEIPGQPGLTMLAEQNVEGGKINLKTDQLQLPGRVWVDILGKHTLEFIVDSKDQIWIEGKAKFLSEVDVKGSNIELEYNKVRKLFKEKYEEPQEPIVKQIEKIESKEKMTKEDEVMLEVHKMRKMRLDRARASFAKVNVEKNPSRELSLFLLKDELKDSLDLQKKLFKRMSVENRNSNIYTVLESQLR
ncbi:MAG: hypothetical protein ACRDDZ_02210 [Marinifilaceae bacterium]